MNDNRWHRANEDEKRKHLIGSYFIAGLIGAIVGGSLVILLLIAIGIGPFRQNPLDESARFDRHEIQNTQQVFVEVETDITKAVEKSRNSVVGISNYESGDIWEETREVATGSGVVYKKEGDKAYIITNYHVVEGADILEVILPDGTKLEAEFLGGDIWTDLALLTVSGETIDSVIEIGNSDLLKLGEPVIAIGNPLGMEYAGSVTKGIISGLERAVPVDIDQDGMIDWNAEVLQTDAAINPGNSGGALVNIVGQLIGINSMKIAQQEVEGIGFSIPINMVLPIIEDLERYGEVKRPFMGVYLRDLNTVSAYHRQFTLQLPEMVTTGVLLSGVEPGGPADQGGLQEMDVIVSLDGKDIENIIALRKYLYQEKEIGETLRVGYFRNGAYYDTTITLSEAQ